MIQFEVELTYAVKATRALIEVRVIITTTDAAEAYIQGQVAANELLREGLEVDLIAGSCRSS